MSCQVVITVLYSYHTVIIQTCFPVMFSSLPADIRLRESVPSFKRHFKNPSVQTDLVLLRCCKRLCILGPHGAIEICVIIIIITNMRGPVCIENTGNYMVHYRRN